MRTTVGDHVSANKQQKERDKAIRHLFDYIEQSPRWSPLFEELSRQFMHPVANHLDEDTHMVDIRLQGGPYGSMSFGFLMEQMAVSSWHNEGETPIDVYLEKRGWREGPHGRRYLIALNQSEHDLLEVTNVEPGRWVELRPYGTTAPVKRVLERGASESLHPFDVVVARVVTLGNAYRFGAILPLSPDGAHYLKGQIDTVASDLTQWYEELVEEEGPEGLVVNFANDIPMERQRRIDEYGFMCWAIDVLDPPPMQVPQMRNTNDERIVMTAFRFPVIGDVDKISDSLTTHTDIIDDGDNHWSWLNSDGSNTVLGQFTLNHKELVFNTNSVERGERGVALVQERLGSTLVGQPLGVHENIEDLLASMPPEQTFDPDLQHIPEVQIAMQQHLMQHYRNTLDEPIPMLDNDTPRECSTDESKRSKVIEWLKFLENADSKSPNTTQDFGWMWEELGLSKYR